MVKSPQIFITMGQYLAIGIASAIGVDKQKAEKEFKGLDYFKNAFEKEFNQRGIYQLNETETFIQFDLKPEIAQKEWEEFIQSFYELRYNSDDLYPEHSNEALEEIGNEHDLQGWLNLAKERRFECYQMTELYYYPMDNPLSFDGYSYVGMDMVVLSLDGKIFMECYGSLFDFLTRIIREKLSRFSLSDSLFLYITD